jgi:RNA-directed DNA polymerase
MRKRKVHGLFDPMTEFSTLRRAFKAAAAGKRDRLAVLSFEMRLEDNLFRLRDELRAETYGFGPYRSFYVHEPKLRLIESACFRDRVVHHALHASLEPLFDAKFYEYSFACRTGRGTHAAMLTLHDWTRRSKREIFLKCDIRKFFPSVDRTRLMSILDRSLGDERLMRLLEKLVMGAPRTGIPIGNLTSQLFANLYLNELDQFVKRQLRVRHYIRYMDDFVALCETPEEARRLRDTVEVFLRDELKMELSPEKVMIGQVRQGIPFVGYYQRPSGIRVRGAALRRCRKKVRKAYRASFGPHHEMGEDFWTSPKTRHSKFFGSWSSFVGQTNYANDGLYLQQKLARELEWLPP